MMKGPLEVILSKIISSLWKHYQMETKPKWLHTSFDKLDNTFTFIWGSLDPGSAEGT